MGELDGYLEFCRAGRQSFERANGAGRAAANLYQQRSVALLADLFQALCDIRGVETLVECGAMEASASREFRRRNPSRVAVALEANPKTFERLTRSAIDEGVLALAEGVSDQSGTFKLLIPAKSSTSMASFRRQVKERGTVIDEVLVPVTTLDLLDKRLEFEGPIALWIDVEGVSLQVLKGAQSVLARTVLIMIEMHDAQIWHGQSDSKNVMQHLSGAGFMPLARDFQTGDNLYNVVLARSDSQAPDALLNECRTRLTRLPRGWRARTVLARANGLRSRARLALTQRLWRASEFTAGTTRKT